jgi:hypothetical protein
VEIMPYSPQEKAGLRFLKNVLSRVGYPEETTIDKIFFRKDGDKVTVVAEITLPDMSQDPTIALQEAMSEDKMTELATKLMDEGKITESTSEEDMFEIIMSEVIKVAEDEIKNSHKLDFIDCVVKSICFLRFFALYYKDV